MPRIVKPLSDATIKKNKPKEKMYKIYDGDGLCLKIFPNGRKIWQFDYTLNGKRNSASLGRYPDVNLSEARDKKLIYRKMVSEGKVPSIKKKISSKKMVTLNEVADEY